MILTSIFAVTSGLLLLWIVLSIVTIQIQEWVNTKLNTRAQIIEDAINEMLANSNLKAQFYDHPIIRGLTVKQRGGQSQVPIWFYRYPLIRGFTRENRKIPSYIPSQQFALVLFDLATTAGTESTLIQQGLLKVRDDLIRYARKSDMQGTISELNLLSDFARSAATTEAGTASTRRSLAALKGEVKKFSAKYPELNWMTEQILDESERLKSQIDEVLKMQPRNLNSPFSKLRRGFAAWSVISPVLSQTLNALALDLEDRAQSDEEKFSLLRESVEKWFDDTMDRVSGAFKRYSQSLALIIGIYLAVILNIDMISFGSYLWREPFIRQVLLANASKFEVSQEEFVIHPRQAMQDFRKQFIGLSLPPIG